MTSRRQPSQPTVSPQLLVRRNTIRKTNVVTNRLACCSLYMMLPGPHGLYIACKT